MKWRSFISFRSLVLPRAIGLAAMFEDFESDHEGQEVLDELLRDEQAPPPQAAVTQLSIITEADEEDAPQAAVSQPSMITQDDEEEDGASSYSVRFVKRRYTYKQARRSEETAWLAQAMKPSVHIQIHTCALPCSSARGSCISSSGVWALEI